MAGSINKVILVGNLGADPEIRSLTSGDRVANLRIATSETWRDRATGERKERTEWHRVVIFNENIVKVAGDLDLNGCVQFLFASRCERAGAADYGRWGQQTLRLVTGRVEASGDNQSFHTLAVQAANCVIPPLG